MKILTFCIWKLYYTISIIWLNNLWLWHILKTKINRHIYFFSTHPTPTAKGQFHLQMMRLLRGAHRQVREIRVRERDIFVWNSNHRTRVPDKKTEGTCIYPTFLVRDQDLSPPNVRLGRQSLSNQNVRSGTPVRSGAAFPGPHSESLLFHSLTFTCKITVR